MAGPLDGDVLAPGQTWAIDYGHGDPVVVELVSMTSATRWRGISQDGTLHVLDASDPLVSWEPVIVDRYVEVDGEAVLVELSTLQAALDQLWSLRNVNGRPWVHSHPEARGLLEIASGAARILDSMLTGD